MILSKGLFKGLRRASPPGTQIIKLSCMAGEASAGGTTTATTSDKPSVDENIGSSAESGAKGPETHRSSGKVEGSSLRALFKEKEALLKLKDRMVADAKQEVLTCLAEVENLRGKTRRDSDSIKKHAVESFAADLLDMADNLHRTAAIVPESFRKDVLANDASSNAKLLLSMLEGVNMTEKQMLKIFGEFGVKKFDPIGDRYDSNHHLLIDEVEDSTKEPHTIVNVVKSGYFIREKVLRPAEVGVVKKAAADSGATKEAVE